MVWKFPGKFPRKSKISERRNTEWKIPEKSQTERKFPLKKSSGNFGISHKVVLFENYEYTVPFFSENFPKLKPEFFIE